MGNKFTSICGTSGGTAAAVIALASAGHGVSGVIVAATAVVLATTIPPLARDLFWLRALSQSRRDLAWLLRNTELTSDAERLARELRIAVQDVVNARSVHSRKRTRRGINGTKSS